MHISLVINKKEFQPGEVLPPDSIVSKVPQETVILGKGEQNPKGEEVLITGTIYFVGRKEYDLEGYAIRAILCDGLLVPCLRKSRGAEIYAETKIVKPSPRHVPERVGELTLWWPEIVKLPKEEQEEISNELVQEALDTTDQVDETLNNYFECVEPLEIIDYYPEEE
jgi:hypothetical protein